MICYRLRCAHDHVFEGWYKDSSTFAMLRQKNLLNCPECGTSSVDQAPMAPAIVGRAPERLPQSDPTPTPDMAAPPAPVAGRYPPACRMPC